MLFPTLTVSSLAFPCTLNFEIAEAAGAPDCPGCPALSCPALPCRLGPALLCWPAVLGLALGMGKKKEERGMFGNSDAVGPLLPSAGSYNFQNTDPSWM